MTKILEIASFFVWFLCFFYEIIFILKNNKSLFKNLKENWFYIIRLDKLLLIIVFIIYAHFNKDFVTILVFLVISLYLYINKLYEKSKKEKLLTILKQNWLSLLIVLILTLIPFSYYFITKNLYNTYATLLVYLYFSYFIIGVCKFVGDKILRK